MSNGLQLSNLNTKNMSGRPFLFLFRKYKGVLSEMDEIWSERVGTLRRILFPSWCTVIRRVRRVLARWTQSTDLHESSSWRRSGSRSADEVILSGEEFAVAFGKPGTFEVGVPSRYQGVTDIHVFRIPGWVVEEEHPFKL